MRRYEDDIVLILGANALLSFASATAIRFAEVEPFSDGLVGEQASRPTFMIRVRARPALGGRLRRRRAATSLAR
jgi:hypothetical protein